MRHAVLVAILVGALIPRLTAQDRPAPTANPPATAPAATEPARPAPRLRNVRFEIVITEGGTLPKPTPKKVSLIVATGREGQVRSIAVEPQANMGTRAVPLNVDVIRPVILDDGSINVAIVIEYQPTSPGTLAIPSSVKARLDAILPNGRKTLITETADPTSERTTTLEVTATVLP